MDGRVRRMAAAISLTGASLAALTTAGMPSAGAVSGPLCTGVSSVTAGTTHAFARGSDASVYAWGANTRGQLALTPATNRLSPTKADSLTTASQISGGSMFTLALYPTGVVRGVGYNSYGQLGNGSTADSKTLVDPGLANITAVDAGGSHSLALAGDGTVWAWGRNSEGQLGDGTFTQRTSPVQVSGLTNVVAIAAGWNNSFAIRNDGTIWGWGANTYGELGNGTKVNSNVPVQTTGITTATAVEPGTNHVVALLSDGTVKAWGSNTQGQLGVPGASKTSPITVSGISGVTSIASGAYHILARTSDGKVWGWGSNAEGQLGLGDGAASPPVTNGPANSLTPVEITGAGGATTIAAGQRSSYAIRAAGTLWAWGLNVSGQLGDATTTNRPEPVRTGCPDAANRAPWTVVLVADPPIAAPGTPVTLTAVANQDVGSSPHAIMIFDNATKLLLNSCATGTTCSAIVTSPVATYKGYTAYVGTPSTTPPPPFTQASAQIVVTWGPTGPGEYSSSCDAGEALFDATGPTGTRLAIRTLRVNSDETHVCFQASDKSAFVGGRVVLVAPAITPTTITVDDNQNDACNAPDNAAAQMNPVFDGRDKSLPVLVGVHAKGTNASICIMAEQHNKRVGVSLTAQPSINPDIDGF